MRAKYWASRECIAKKAIVWSHCVDCHMKHDTVSWWNITTCREWNARVCISAKPNAICIKKCHLRLQEWNFAWDNSVGCTWWVTQFSDDLKVVLNRSTRQPLRHAYDNKYAYITNEMYMHYNGTISLERLILLLKFAVVAVIEKKKIEHNFGGHKVGSKAIKDCFIRKNLQVE